MKQIYLLAITLMMLTSCGNKLYSYRKTVDVNEKRASANAKGSSNAKVSIYIVPNTSYMASKPIDKKPEPSIHSADNTSSSSMVR